MGSTRSNESERNRTVAETKGTGAFRSGIGAPGSQDMRHDGAEAGRWHAGEVMSGGYAASAILIRNGSQK